ncbi:hypothetical protein DFJ73DRAFT_834201 [Zopfochytrium polystomum]|nr:hypothetical protein DFJ73DRAFT_834201 [Zopfochytrium polystomum]
MAARRHRLRLGRRRTPRRRRRCRSPVGRRRRREAALGKRRVRPARYRRRGRGNEGVHRAARHRGRLPPQHSRKAGTTLPRTSGRAATASTSPAPSTSCAPPPPPASAASSTPPARPSSTTWHSASRPTLTSTSPSCRSPAGTRAARVPSATTHDQRSRRRPSSRSGTASAGCGPWPPGRRGCTGTGTTRTSSLIWRRQSRRRPLPTSTWTRALSKTSCTATSWPTTACSETRTASADRLSTSKDPARCGPAS